jgi:hypothetical protein
MGKHIGDGGEQKGLGRPTPATPCPGALLSHAHTGHAPKVGPASLHSKALTCDKGHTCQGDGKSAVFEIYVHTYIFFSIYFLLENIIKIITSPGNFYKT